LFWGFSLGKFLPDEFTPLFRMTTRAVDQSAAWACRAHEIGCYVLPFKGSGQGPQTQAQERSHQQPYPLDA
jgi:hypothetical protein